jgi:hypothetical protein
MHTQAQLQAAFNSTQLGRLGYTLDSAMANKALAICLNRLASIKEKSAPVPKTYWYQNI